MACNLPSMASSKPQGPLRETLRERDLPNVAGFTARWQQAYRAYVNGEW
jgi:hypothetical protein